MKYYRIRDDHDGIETKIEQTLIKATDLEDAIDRIDEGIRETDKFIYDNSAGGTINKEHSKEITREEYIEGLRDKLKKVLEQADIVIQELNKELEASK